MESLLGTVLGGLFGLLIGFGAYRARFEQMGKEVDSLKAWREKQAEVNENTKTSMAVLGREVESVKNGVQRVEEKLDKLPETLSSMIRLGRDIGRG